MTTTKNPRRQNDQVSIIVYINSYINSSSRYSVLDASTAQVVLQLSQRSETYSTSPIRNSHLGKLGHLRSVMTAYRITWPHSPMIAITSHMLIGTIKLNVAENGYRERERRLLEEEEC
ncbi:hypothetical protein BDDG_08472 [Blastomyces dermatitidis ATCC 18188]|uniref:Uncharacterized protein n=1 Tax=Ajellomyces dermatitidis (strain ATCC 18188 / CBS 674.68) TaxID=653446 RepID=F2TQL4_AJEDA|nr:hypothetical protein BDDG_08472 [Blastomyces dermatitidis ATCC 18188]